MTSVEQEHGIRQERRWNKAWALTPYALLGIACAVSFTGTSPGRPHQLGTMGIVVVLVAWHGWFVVAHPRWWERATTLMIIYFAGLLALTALLVSRSGAFQLFIPVCYVLAFVTLPGLLAYAGVIAANLPWLASPSTEPRQLLLSLAVATPLAALIGWAIRGMEREAVRRRETNARLVAVAAENAELHQLLLEKARETGMTEERARMAREIHDTVAQGLTGVVTQLEVAEELSAEGPARERIGLARELARTSLVEVRRSIDALRPGPLEDARLGEALEKTLAAWRDQHDIAASLTVTGTPRPAHAEVEVTVLRAAQEALSNVGRHARATRVDLTLSYMEDLIVLDVRDDGKGFDTSREGGFGLHALRERVRRLSGTVEVESAQLKGTAVSVSLPMIGAES
ncbi:hypothetical protein BAY61_05510 [Prauserella marina]|uniref:Signal transduction histidine kinase n=1 Tax=Prauserella marina TaxID=530584 RepID=A0A222VKS9_9PSEU|nr:sensor histidine kinase [Prauserella marina]ASR34536.1 hypothetical protein BAY61_05510 [Prauserella marina]PWV85856.1 signal transduction histidine kinase [Prauserella marina]SDC43826.1 Signal transduction histidine kinase [Prauserella marina]